MDLKSFEPMRAASAGCRQYSSTPAPQRHKPQPLARRRCRIHHHSRQVRPVGKHTNPLSLLGEDRQGRLYETALCARTASRGYNRRRSFVPQQFSDGRHLSEVSIVCHFRSIFIGAGAPWVGFLHRDGGPGRAVAGSGSGGWQ